ncbi:hypothetical protein Tco_0418579 [Tanacetum coccineum]
MVEEVTSLKKDFKQKENKYLEEFLDMKALKEKVSWPVVEVNNISLLFPNNTCILFPLTVLTESAYLRILSFGDWHHLRGLTAVLNDLAALTGAVVLEKLCLAVLNGTRQTGKTAVGAKIPSRIRKIFVD